jgi:hypothetical protein
MLSRAVDEPMTATFPWSPAQSRNRLEKPSRNIRLRFIAASHPGRTPQEPLEPTTKISGSGGIARLKSVTIGRQ